MLKALIEIALASIQDNQPIFQPLAEPILYRKFVKWVREGLKEAQAAAQKLKDASGATQ